MADGKITGQELANGITITNGNLTGVPTVPTASIGTNTTQAASTAFVNAEIANDAFLAGEKARIGETADGTDANTYDFPSGLTVVGTNTTNMPLGTGYYWLVTCFRLGNTDRIMFAEALATGSPVFLRAQRSGVWNSWTPLTINASGSAPIYACRAWVNFNGTGTVAIRSSGNVSSITDNGTGDYTVNFNNNMPDVNYSTVALCREDYSSNTLGGVLAQGARFTPTTSNVRIHTKIFGASAAFSDAIEVNVAIFR